MSTFRLGPGLRVQIEREARAAFPRECCGLIEGARRDATIAASVFHATRNVAKESDRFEVDPADQFRILREARVRGAEIVGCYHSHPNGAHKPSARDRESGGEEGFVWLIAALTNHGDVRLRAFIISSGLFAPLAIE